MTTRFMKNEMEDFLTMRWYIFDECFWVILKLVENQGFRKGVGVVEWLVIDGCSIETDDNHYFSIVW